MCEFCGSGPHCQVCGRGIDKAVNTFACAVCGADLGWDRPSGVCSGLCLNIAQGFSQPDPCGELLAPVLGGEG